MHLNSTKCHHHTTIHGHSITLCSITRYPNTMHSEEIEVDTEVEDKVEEDLGKAEGQ
jgi:hypothetical protein